MAILGTREMWVCYACDKHAATVVVEPSGMDAPRVDLCAECLRGALDTINDSD